MTKAKLFIQADQYLSNGGFFESFISINQRCVLRDLLKGEEGDYFATLLLALKKRIETMPETYQTNGQGTSAKVYLHYFRGGIDAWITERDKGDGTDDKGQHQAFGKINLGSGGGLGYISIAELIENDVEIDLHWNPETTLKDLK